MVVEFSIGINQVCTQNQARIMQLLLFDIGNRNSFIFQLNLLYNNQYHMSQIFETTHITSVLRMIHEHANSNCSTVRVLGEEHEGSHHSSEFFDRSCCVVDQYITVVINNDKTNSKHHILTTMPRISNIKIY